MGFRFRKSINLGGGFRVNLSKSGIGYSFGTKGMRWTQLANGRSRSTYSIPGTGIAYISESSKNKKGKKEPQNNITQQDNMDLEYSTSTEIEENEAIYDDFIDQLNTIITNIKVWRIWMLIFCVITLFFIPFIIVPIALIVLRKIYKQYYVVDLNYNFDNEYKDYYSSINLFFSELANNDKLWVIENRYTNKNTRYSGGATTTSKRVLIKLEKKKAIYLNANVEYYGFEFQKKKFYFLPDRLLIDDNTNICSLRYSEFQFAFDTVDFIEEEFSPADAEKISRTWKYVNKNGSPDKRFKDNYEIPIYKYGTMLLKSNNGLDILFYFSNYQKVQMLKQLYDSLTVKRLNFTFDL
jgi:hypothetical protein